MSILYNGPDDKDPKMKIVSKEKPLYTEGQEPKKWYDPDNLKAWRDRTDKLFRTEDGLLKGEDDSTEPILGLWKGIHAYPKVDGVKGKGAIKRLTKDRVADGMAWSAATVSNGAMALTNQDFDSIQKAWKPSAGHYVYLNNAFKSTDNSAYKNNLYQAKPFSRDEKTGTYNKLSVGDILFMGRDNKDEPELSSKGWGFNNFMRAAKTDKVYSSHTDLITELGEDENGPYYLTTGGNTSAPKSEDNSVVGNDETFASKKVYYDKETGRIKGGKYQGYMQFNQEYKDRETGVGHANSKSVEKIAMSNIDKPTGVETIKPKTVKHLLYTAVPNKKFL